MMIVLADTSRASDNTRPWCFGVSVGSAIIRTELPPTAQHAEEFTPVVAGCSDGISVRYSGEVEDAFGLRVHALSYAG
jgi:hypothetical protein